MRVKHLQVIISGKHQQAGTCFHSPTKSQDTRLLAWPGVSSSLNKSNMDQPQHHAGLTQCLLVDCSIQINYRALRACKTPLFVFCNTIWGWSSTAVAWVCAIAPSKQAMWERWKRNLNIELHTVLPLWSLLRPRVFVCFCWHVSERNNAVPHRPHTTLVVGLKRALKKRRAGLYSCSWRLRESLSFKQCVGRPSGAQRHTIPSSSDIIIHQQQRGDTDGWRKRGWGWKVGGWDRLNRGTFQYEEGWRWRKALKARCGLTHSLNNTNDAAAPQVLQSSQSLWPRENQNKNIRNWKTFNRLILQLCQETLSGLSTDVS